VARPDQLTVLLALLMAGCATGLRRPAITVGIDLDADWRVDRIETIEEGRVKRVVEAPPPGSKPARTVVIAIDAVSYEVFARLQRQGLFREFFPAARMIGPFPSLTNAGYAAILKTARGLGYEDRFYDPVRNRVGGGVFDRLRNQYRRAAPFHELFDWEPPSFWGVTIYKFPMTVSKAELRDRGDPPFERRRRARPLLRRHRRARPRPRLERGPPAGVRAARPVSHSESLHNVP
jgi:hypothetical protein